MDSRGRIVTSLYISVEVLIALVSIAGNVLVCLAVRVNSRLRSATNYFLVSLAMADIAVGLLVIPVSVLLSVELPMNVHGCLFLACLVLIFTQNSIFSLLAIAIDRYLAVKLPLRYSSLVTGRCTQRVIAILWLLSLTIGLVPLFGWNLADSAPRICNETGGGGASRGGDEPQRNRTAPCHLVICLFEEVMDLTYMVYFNFLACVLLPLLAMLAIYAKIFSVTRCQLQRLEAMDRTPGSSRTTLHREVQAAKSLLMVVGLFALCWLPLHALNTLTVLCPGCGRSPLWLMDATIVLSHANSAVNPAIYAYRLREFRGTFADIVRGGRGPRGWRRGSPP